MMGAERRDEVAELALQRCHERVIGKLGESSGNIGGCGGSRQSHPLEKIPARSYPVGISRCSAAPRKSSGPPGRYLPRLSVARGRWVMVNGAPLLSVL